MHETLFDATRCKNALVKTTNGKKWKNEGEGRREKNDGPEEREKERDREGAWWRRGETSWNNGIEVA